LLLRTVLLVLFLFFEFLFFEFFAGGDALTMFSLDVHMSYGEREHVAYHNGTFGITSASEDLGRYLLEDWPVISGSHPRGI
jgi:hypothetical protein